MGEWRGHPPDRWSATGRTYDRLRPGVKDAGDGKKKVRQGEADLFFELPAVSPEEFREAVELGEVFPHKTTYFYPKLYTGFVARFLDSD